MKNRTANRDETGTANREPSFGEPCDRDMQDDIPKLVEVIKNSEFASHALEATRTFLFLHFKDWEHIDMKGGTVFKDRESEVLYLSLCAMLDKNPRDFPDVSGARVPIGGVMMSAQALLNLEAAALRPTETETDRN